MFHSNSCDLFRYLHKHRKIETTSGGRKIKLISNTIIPDKTKGKGNGGAFYIKKKDYGDFINLYATELERNRFKMHLTENFDDLSPIVIDLDLRFNSCLQNSLIDDNIVKKIVKIHIDYVSQHFVPGKNNKHLTCIVMKSKSNPVFDSKRGYTKDGLHIHFPFIKTDRPYKIIMRHHLKSKIAKIVSKIGNTNSEDSVYDYGIISGTGRWCLYGASKPGKEPYLIYKVYRVKTKNNNECLVNVTKKFHKCYKNRKPDLVKLLSVYIKRNPTGFKSVQVLQTLRGEYAQLKGQQISKNIQKEQKMFNSFSGFNKVDGTASDLEDYEIKEIKDLMLCINTKRAFEYGTWISIGLSLHNISKDLIWLWKEFSKQCPEKYDEDTCNNKWESFDKNPSEYEIFKKVPLIKLAQLDNNDKYNKLKHHHVYHMILQLSQRINHNDTAKILHKMYGKNIVCSIDKKIKKWYMFIEHVWEEMEPELHLRNFISEQLVKECNRVIETINKRDEDYHAQPDMYNERLNNNLRLFKNSLKTTSFKSSIIKECETVFAKNKFHHNLDNNRYLIGLKNGIYDLKNHIFRSGRPADNISLRANIDYDPTSQYDELEDFLNKILPIKELKTFVLKILAVSISGIFLQRLFICIGVGSNGKTTLLDLMEELLGSDFFANVHHTLITKGKMNSSGPSPELAKTKGKRLVFMEEPDTRDRLNVGQLKWLTGGGHIAARFLNENEIEFNPFYKIFFLVNNEPHIDSTDYGTWRRILCIPFISLFLDDPKPTPQTPHRYKINRSVNQNFTKWAPAFFNILVQYFKLYQQEGLKPPLIVVNETNKFKTACDYIFAFTNMNIIKTDNDTDYITFPKIYKRFEVWYRANRGSKAPEPREIKKLLEANYFKTQMSLISSFEEGWKGHKLRPMGEKNNDKVDNFTLDNTDNTNDTNDTDDLIN